MLNYAFKEIILWAHVARGWTSYTLAKSNLRQDVPQKSELLALTPFLKLIVPGWGGTATGCTLNSYPFDCNIYSNFNFLLIKHILKHFIYVH